MDKNQGIPSRKKRGVGKSKDPPFPIPIGSIAQSFPFRHDWVHYTGQLLHNHVIIRHSGDMDFIYRMGFFGKGDMSRSQPDFQERHQTVHIPDRTTGQVSKLVVMRKRRYIRHKRWQMSHDQEKEADRVEWSSTESEDQCETGSDGEELEFGATDCIQQSAKVRQADEQTAGIQGSGVMQEEVDTSAGQRSEAVAMDSWATAGSDEEFWESDTLQTKTAEMVVETVNALTYWDNTEGDEEFWGTEEKSSGVWDEAGKSQTVTLDNKNSVGCPVEEMPDSINDTRTSSTDDMEIKGQSDDTKCVDRQTSCEVKGHPTNSGSEWTSSCSNSGVSEASAKSSVQNQVDEISENLLDRNNSSSNNVTHSLEACTNESRLSGTELDANVGKSCDIVLSAVLSHRLKEATPTNLSNHHNDSLSPATELFSTGVKEKDNFCENVEAKARETTVLEDGTREAIHPDSEPREVIEEGPIHPLCGSEDSEGNVLVIEDSDYEGHVGRRKKRRKSRVWHAVRKAEPYPFTESLWLSLEEAVFLSFGLGCLTVLDEDKKPMTITDLWQRCCNLEPSFLPKYTAYHYFRSKGWVPKSGLKFGSDFILYREGPPFYHGSYSVVVRCVRDGDYTEVPEFTDRKFSWTTLSGLNRTTEHVAKVLMLCYVVMPTELTKEDLSSPMCISRFRVRVVKRWVSSQERDKEQEIDAL